MAYDAIVVPGCETLRASTLERLEAFREKGGKLVFLGDAPRYVEAVEDSRGRRLWERCDPVPFERHALLTALENVRTVDIRDADGLRSNDLLHQLRTDGEDRWLFIAHLDKPYCRDIPVGKERRISLEGSWSVRCYDTLSGEIRPVKSVFSGGSTTVTAKLYDLDSLLLRFSPRKEEAAAPEEERQPKRLCPVPSVVDYTLSEKNAYLLDKAEYALDGEAWRPSQELLRADNDLRRSLGLPRREGGVAQPWTVPDVPPEHTARLRFRVECDRQIPAVELALEDADIAKVWLNGEKVDAVPKGWFTDKSIGVLPLGDLRRGTNEIVVELPFGERTNIEWCYLLGDFGVKLQGTFRQLTAREEKLGFSDITAQSLPHYSGNLTYALPIRTEGGDIRITVPHYVGAAVRAELSGKSGYIVLPPYSLTLEDIPAGEHMLKLTLLGNRHNAFGPLHLADSERRWIGPDAWRTGGSYWTESYRLKPLGLLTAPIIEELE